MGLTPPPHLDVIIEFAKLLVAIVGAFGGGIGVAWYWNRKKDKLERYQYLDQCYGEILKAYFDYPQFGHSQFTSNYVSAFIDPMPCAIIISR
jgi:hypothetical protein